MDKNIFAETYEDKESDSSPTKLQFLVNTVCAIKNTLKDSLNEIVEKHKEDTGKIIDSYVPPGCHGSSGYKDIWNIKDINNFPDVLINRGFGDYFRQEFVQGFLDKGYFKEVARDGVNKDFLDCEMQRKNQYYNIYAVIPFLIMIDKKNIDNLPIPTKWEDLLNPIYKDKIIVGGSEKDVSDILLLYMYKDFGEAGIKKLASNVKDKMHWTNMVKLVGTKKENSAAIYVIPWFFAEACPSNKEIDIIWPEDGAIISPMFMLVKERYMEDMKVITDFVTGVDFGKKLAKSFNPSLNPYVDNNLPDNASFKWLGWDFIESNDIEELKSHIKNIFIDNWK